ncbi:MAG: PIN domain-containing protein [Candidatus Micrarchaeota archaeon]|nr:PIN domain-containing protein [Candidatus Micrarchaeota archaeon]MDE1824699.1 PIN domain-containing protein [Candidatus Micrarchaeota archaeon]MDE1849104.1 PIN domain-containing protein [Candidatus Micrarchaeota archaeon]
MPYADADFFLAILKPSDWLKDKALKLLDKYRSDITVSEATFVELMLIVKKNGLDPVTITTDAMEICGIDNAVYLKAASFIAEGVGVLDAFHAAHADDEIISSDSVYDKLGILRIKLEE